MTRWAPYLSRLVLSKVSCWMTFLSLTGRSALFQHAAKWHAYLGLSRLARFATLRLFDESETKWRISQNLVHLMIHQFATGLILQEL